MTSTAVFASIVVVCVAAFLITVVLSPGFRDADRLMDRLERHQVVVTLADGTAFEGVLYDTDATSVLLKNAAALGRGGERTPADGDVILPRNHIAYLQRP